MLRTVHLAALAAVVIGVGGIGVTSASAQVEGQNGAGQFVVTGFPAGGMFVTSKGDNDSFNDYGLGGAFAWNVNRWIGVEGEIGGGVGISNSLTVDGERLTNASLPRTLFYNGNVVYSPIGNDRPLAPYVTGGIGGLTMFSRRATERIGVASNDTFFTGNLGGGVQWWGTRHFGLRGDYRLLVVRSDSDSTPFFARDDTRYAHRIYGGIVLTPGR